uniref:Protein kinase domain-containing protein n=1 Tax=Clytia hemisphaerica TaxID=252671 RepID=A0A7M5WW61_9CNID
MTGHENFVYLFGMVSSPESLLFEYIGDQTTAPSLAIVLSQELVFTHWLHVCLDLVRALDAFHDRGLLHNDLHSGNILLRDMRHVKIIDFGKCTLVDDPVMYSIKPGTAKHARYNTRHKHLAFELRNNPGSYVSYASDVYTLGYNFDLIGSYVKSTQLRKVASFMTMPQPESRSELSAVLSDLSKLL